MKTAVIISLIVFPILCFANPQSDKETDELIIFHTFSGEWEKADSLLQLQISKYPDNPKYYALQGPYYFYTRYFQPRILNNDSLTQEIAESAYKAIEFGEKDAMSLDDKFFVGTAYGYLSRYYVSRGSFWDAYWATRSCRAYLNEVLEEDPTYTDAKMGLAVIEYFTATRLRGFWGFVAWVVGMSGNRDTALMQFHDVAEHGYWFQFEAQFALSAVYRYFETNYVQAYAIITPLHERFPQNGWISAQYRVLRFFDLVENRGIDFLENEFDSLQTTYQVNNATILNEFGYALYFVNRLDEALKTFKANIKLIQRIQILV